MCSKKFLILLLSMRKFANKIRSVVHGLIRSSFFVSVFVVEAARESSVVGLQF